MTLDEFTAEVCERLRADMQSIRHPEGDIHPALFYTFDGETIRRFKIPRSWFDREAKHAMAKAIGQAMAMSRPRMVAFETTTFMLKVDIEEVERFEAGRGGTQIKDIPGRVENVTVVAMDRTELRYAEAVISRDGRNPPTYGEWAIITPDRMEGAIYDPIRRGMQG